MSADPGERTFEVNVADVVNDDVTGTVAVTLDDDTLSATAVLSDKERRLLKRVLEKIIRTLFAVEAAVEVGPDGTIRGVIRLRT